MAFYLAAPFLFIGLCRLTERYRPLHIFIVLILAGVLFRVVMREYGHYLGDNIWVVSIYCPTISNLDLFCGGMLTNWLLEKRSARPWDRSLIVLGLMFLYFGGAWIHSEVLTAHLSRTFSDFGAGVTAVTVVAMIVGLETTKPHGRLVRGTQWFGILTYAVYVVHEPILLAIRRKIPGGLAQVESIELTAVAIAITIFVAAIAYWLIERPFDQIKRRRSGGASMLSAGPISSTLVAAEARDVGAVGSVRTPSMVKD